MYHLYQFHHMMPGEFYKLGTGEKIILKAFCEKEIEDYNKTFGGKR